MVRITLAILALLQLTLGFALPPLSLAQEWAVRATRRGTLRVVDLQIGLTYSMMMNYAEPLITLDKDQNWVPCLAEDWRWLDDRTIEFALREGVTFHNGEKLDAEAVRVNWEEYRRMETPVQYPLAKMPNGTELEVIDEYTIRFKFPEPDGLSFAKFGLFVQFAPGFFVEHKFQELNWGFLPEPGPWGTGPFKFVEGSLGFGTPSERVVLEAHEDYWDRRYPKVKRVIFDNTLQEDRKEAMRLCRESEGAVDIVTHIRPLDTLKVAESLFAKVVKSRDVSILWGNFNLRKKDSKWRDVRLRKAVNYAINRKELWKYAAKGNAYNLEGFFIPPGAYGHNPNLTAYAYDTTKARTLLAEAGYPDGFEAKIVVNEAWGLEAQIIKRMLWRIGIEVELEVVTWPEYVRKVYIPMLEKPPEEMDWDMTFTCLFDWWGHIGLSFLPWPTEAAGWRWVEHDPAYEEMWKHMARTVDPEEQEEKVRQLVEYQYEGAYAPLIYSPLSLYAVNKEVNFVPQKSLFLRLKETSVTDNHWSVRGEAEDEVE